MSESRILAAACAAAAALWCAAAVAQSPAATRPVSSSDLLSDRDSARFRAAQALVRQKQCAAASANPLLAMSVEIVMPGAALAELPAEYMRARASAADARSREVLSARVAELIATYDESACAMRWNASSRLPTTAFMPPTF